MIPIRVCIVFFLLVVCGCTTVLPGRRSHGSGLDRDEKDLARALASFAQGLIYETEEGRNSPNALRYYARAAELDPKSPLVQSRLGRSAFRSNRHAAALAAFEEACRLNPTSFDARLELAVTCSAVGESKRAAEVLAEGIMIDPSQPVGYIALSRLLFRNGRDKEAIATLEKGMDHVSEPEDLLSFCYVQSLEFVPEQPQRTITCSRFVTSHRTARQGRFALLYGEIYENLGDLKEAARNYDIATRQDDPHERAFARLAFAQIDNSLAEGIRTLERGQEVLPDSLVVLFTLGYLYHADGRHDDAVAVFEKVIALAGKREGSELSASFYLSYGSALEQGKRTDEAEKVFLKCIEIHPDAHEVLNYLAYMWSEQGRNLDRALEFVRSALKHEPENPAYTDTLGWIHYKQERFEEAMVAIRKANSLLPSDPILNDHMGDVLHALDRTDEAVEYWKRSFVLDPDNEVLREKLRAQGIDPESIPLPKEE